MLLVDSSHCTLSDSSSGFRRGPPTLSAIWQSSPQARGSFPQGPALTNTRIPHGHGTHVDRGCASLAGATCGNSPCPDERERRNKNSARQCKDTSSGCEHGDAEDSERRLKEQWQRLRQESAVLQQQCRVNRQGLDDLRQLTKQLSALVVKPGVSTIAPKWSKRGRDAEVEALVPHLRKQPTSQHAPQGRDLEGVSVEGLQKLLEFERAKHADYIQQLQKNACEIEVLMASYRELSSQLHVLS
uniref:Uncharacterized protein n=1 Tax=Calcidiscus leptoporus TaxID=127549 RepID=A0A7S0JDS7_9EUKA|mmetsp:Transcript_53221/g.122287  ORF Transcript_53221/g.122287 Transcript_53221/m.122287 type:complete len:243 (+) Transcript_53221:83-811(+)